MMKHFLLSFMLIKGPAFVYNADIFRLFVSRT